MQASIRATEWFQDSRFGMFIHWGLYSILARGEWVMDTEKIPVPEYEKLAGRFNPSRFSAPEWIKLAEDAGQRYMVITSRHHDGFSMFDTALSPYKVTNTPFNRDPLAELAEACRKSGKVKLGFYSSLLDWHHPAYRFRVESGLAWEDYVGFLHGQVRELCSNFGELACIWFDGDWPNHNISAENAHFRAGGSFEYEKLYGMIHALQPDAMVVNNRHAAPLPGEDVQGFEQDLPGGNSSGWNTAGISALPLETCLTINNSWGWSEKDQDLKDSTALIKTLVRAASAGANLLLNVGPTPEGSIHPSQAERLREVGAWLAENGESIYGTRKGAIAPSNRSVSTRKGDTHYIHDLSHETGPLELESVPETVTRAGMMDGTAVKTARKGKGFTIDVPEVKRDPVDTITRLA